MTMNYREAFMALAAVEFDAIVSFYEQVFGCHAQPFVPNTYAEFQLSGVKLGIFKPSDSHTSEFADSTQAGMSLCLEVEDLDGAIAHFTTLGYPPTGTITTASHGREIYAYDPAGNRLILHQAHVRKNPKL